MAIEDTVIMNVMDDPNVLRWHPSGSRYLGCHGEHSDYDIVLLVNNSWSIYDLEHRTSMDFDLGGSLGNDGLVESWKSRVDFSEPYTVNLIVCWDEQVYFSWLSSITMSRDLGLLDKRYRVEWFEKEKELYEARIRESERKAASAMGSGAPF